VSAAETSDPGASGPESGEHPAQRLDDVVHQRVRLGILAVLDQADQADFTYLRNALGLTDGNLSRHLSVLEESGYLAISKTFEGRKPRTWVRSTRGGKAALAEEMAALREILTRYEEKPARPVGDGGEPV
jgi:DNA-binding MarR family transcriptional regulator